MSAYSHLARAALDAAVLIAAGWAFIRVAAFVASGAFPGVL